MSAQYLPEFATIPLEHCEGFDGPCDREDAKWGHTSTMYENERSNWSYLCPGCWEACQEYWGDMWYEYWGGRW